MLPHFSSKAFPLSASLSYNHFSPDFKACSSIISTQIELNSYTQASKDPNLCKAMELELFALEANKTYQFIDLPLSKQAIGYRYIYKFKYNTYGSLERYKARLVAKGTLNKKELTIMRLSHPFQRWLLLSAFISCSY